MKNTVILGSTGSIGENAIRVAQALPSHLQVTGLAVNRNYQRALEQATQLNVKHLAVADPEMAKACRKAAPADMNILEGPAGVEELAGQQETDIVLCAIVGMAGLKPTLAALNNGIDVALATKEILVAAGEIVTGICEKTGARLLPVDSEHSALFQCLASASSISDIKRLILTASGGPFADKPDADFDKVTVAEALNHPRWNMGKKVTIDSATLMNKGLEIIEAHWLFNVSIENIEVVIHPESIVHSMMVFSDGNTMAQLSIPDMRFAIQYALTYPERVDGQLPGLDITEIGSLNFRKPDTERFPCLNLAREAAKRGGTMPTVLNAANEIAVEKFLAEQIHFSGIWELVESAMSDHQVVDNPKLQDIIDADSWARQVTINK